MGEKALYTVLSAKACDNEIIVLDELRFEEPKTKPGAKLFENLVKIKEFKNLTKGNGVLVALPGKNEMVRRALRNLPYIGIEDVRNLNSHGVLQYKYILFPREALEVFK